MSRLVWLGEIGINSNAVGTKWETIGGWGLEALLMTSDSILEAKKDVKETQNRNTDDYLGPPGSPMGRTFLP